MQLNLGEASLKRDLWKLLHVYRLVRDLINLESIGNQRHGTQETIPNFTVNHIKPRT